ncbi:MAG: UvrD-helicase domain-containing protein, partial [Selenomonadaceae bacterium]|nr:UvrD-helicase domain-containing protein [Selenomonadaceae bacterium]
MAWTDEQELAINTEDKNLLVAAAAGSGKTAVLVERIIRKILEGNVNVDEILALTFTHAAADEMLERIENAISNKLETETDENTIAVLERQKILLSGANISTLHSFCQRI